MQILLTTIYYYPLAESFFYLLLKLIPVLELLGNYLYLINCASTNYYTLLYVTENHRITSQLFNLLEMFADVCERK